MSGVAGIVVGGMGSCLAGVACAAIVWLQLAKTARKKRREAAFEGSSRASRFAATAEPRGWALRYAEDLSRRLLTGQTTPLTPCVRERRAGRTRAGSRYSAHAQAAGCSKEVTVSAFCEARTRLAMIGGLVGALAGVVFSSQLAVLLCIAGAVVGLTAPMRDVNGACRERATTAERYLSEMLEVVALGLRSGLTFDRSFALYGMHFQNGFARDCARAHRRWSLGLATREDALRQLSASYECEQLARVVDSMVRSLRFGSALADILEEAAAQSRATYRTALEERVAKAPVKMMVPTGALILPAMLLLVMGPILLELAGGF